MAVPNPINFFHTAKIISENWNELEAHYAQANQTISKPVFSTKARVFEWEKGFDLLGKSRLNVRNASRFIVATDISNFYPSLYTHSIPWALHGKQIAEKQQKFSDNLGNKIDLVIRNGQERQTKGVPIGPDTSFVTAEIVMTAIDKLIVANLGKKYLRYIDDFEFGCSTANDADKVLAGLQEILAEYELTLNSAKTRVIELPIAIDPLWVHELASFQFRETSRGQEKDLLHYFDLSMDRFKNFEDDPVVNYAIKRTSSLNILAPNWSLYENLLLQWATAEPGALPLCIDFIKYHQDNGASINVNRIKDALQHIIRVHAARGHTSELAWAVWGMILFKLHLDMEVVELLANIENPVIALLCLDAQNQRLIRRSYSFVRWGGLMTEQELTGPNWILGYEALLKKWLPSASGKDYLRSAEGFALLQKNKVYFYDPSRTFTYKPRFKYWQFRTRAAKKKKEAAGAVVLSYEDAV